MTREPARLTRVRRSTLAKVGLALVGLVVALELTLAPIVSWRTRTALAACGIDGATVDLGPRPHAWTIVRGRAHDVRVDIEGLHVGSLRLDRVTADLEHLTFGRRQAIGLAAPINIQRGEVDVRITAADLDELLPLPLATVQITPAGVSVDLLGASVPVSVTPSTGNVEFRLFDNSAPPVRLEVPAGVRVTDVEPGSGTLSVHADLTGATAGTGGDLTC